MSLARLLGFGVIIAACGGNTTSVGAPGSTDRQLLKNDDGSPTGDGKTCSFAASPQATYSVGQAVPSPDGCNDCTCTVDGVSCTKKSCEPKACSTEAKLCADGTAVGRTGPSCEFAPCPGEGQNCPAIARVCNDGSTAKTGPKCEQICPGDGNVACTDDAKLCPDGKTYVSRQGPNCEFAPCP